MQAHEQTKEKESRDHINQCRKKLIKPTPSQDKSFQ